jgi:hypothetical protein
MKRKRRETPEERAERKARYEARMKELQYWIERGKAELTAKKKPA